MAEISSHTLGNPSSSQIIAFGVCLVTVHPPSGKLAGRSETECRRRQAKKRNAQ